MPALLHPGVYVQEIPSGVRAVEGVPTSTPIFVGEAERGPLGPTKIKSLVEYDRLFGGYLRVGSGTTTARVALRYAIDGFFANGGGSAYVLRAVDVASPVTASRTFANVGRIDASSPGAWASGRLFALVHSRTDNNTRFRLWVFYRAPGADAPVFVEDWQRLSLNPADDSYAVTVLQRSAYIRWVPDAAANPTPPGPDALAGNAAMPSHPSGLAALPDAARLMNGTGGAASFAASGLPTLLSELDGIDDAALLVGAPDAWFTAADGGWYGALRTYVEARPKQDLFLIADMPRQDVAEPTDATSATVTAANALTRSSFAGLYWPHVRVPDPVGVGPNPTALVPPSGLVAGLYSRIDSRRGVWKAPAGVEATLGGVTGVQHELLDSHQDDLNPLGVNVIRPVPGAGIVVWGARTSVPATEWRYVPVRRTAMFLRKSIYNGIQWAVFEPNDEPLWQSLRTSVGAFMETQYRNGAFAGATSKDAYFVKCDATTTTEIDQANGVVNILVGFAPLRPAEFVVVKLSQITKTAA